MIRLKQMALLTAILPMAFFSCKKSNGGNSPSPFRPLLPVSLKSYLDPGSVDSAWATWKTSTQVQRSKMLIRHDSLIADLQPFTEGAGELKIQLFSNKKLNNQYKTQWVLTKNITLSYATPPSYAGPSSFFDDAWLPRVKLEDGIGHKATVGLRPEDPYFLIEDLEPHLYSLTVDKAFWNTIGGVSLGGEKIWTCNGDCIKDRKSVEDDSFFDDIPGRIGSRSWNHISIGIAYETDKNGGGWLLSLEYEP